MRPSLFLYQNSGVLYEIDLAGRAIVRTQEHFTYTDYPVAFTMFDPGRVMNVSRPQ